MNQNEEILNDWDNLLESVKNNTIQTELLQYFKIWYKLSPTQQEFVCRKNDLDYENYFHFLNKNQKRYIYGFNYNIDLTNYWNIMNNSDRIFAIRYNPYLNINELWNKMNNVCRNLLIDCRKDFNYEKYWTVLNNEQITLVIKNHHDTLNVNKYWNSFNDEHIKNLILTNIIDYSDIDKFNYCINLIKNDVYFLQRLIPYRADDDLLNVSDELLNGYYEEIIDLNNNKNNILLNEILKNIPIYNIKKFDEHENIKESVSIFSFDEKIFLRFFYPEILDTSENFKIDSIQCSFYILKNFNNILRTKKLNRLLNKS